MIGTEILVLLALGVCAFYFLIQKSKYKNLPPGPWGFPLLGHLPLLGEYPYKTLQKWTKSGRFGPVISIKFGSFSSIVINDAKLIREALNQNAFSGRPNIKFFRDRSGGGNPQGIIFTEGYKWSEQRRFTLRHLRDFGFGTKSSMEARIQEEVVELIESFKKDVGKPISILNKFNAAILNAIWSILTGERFSHDDPELAKAIHLLTSNIQENNTIQSVAFFLPWLATFFPKLSGYSKMLEGVEPVTNFIWRPVAAHKETFQDGQHRDFLDMYLQEMKNTTDPKSPFHASNSELMWVLVDLFVAGAETTSTSLSWAFLFLSKYSKVQEKLQQEIDKIVGNSRLPCLNDRPEMHYTQAVIHEILRYSTIVPFSVFHNTLEEVEFAGYTIPKDTMVIPNLYAAHFDEDLWEEPNVFKPERFLNKDGEFQPFHEGFLAFSVGKRVCLGEGLARDELFLFVASLFQRFVVTTVLKPSEIDLDPIVSMILSAKPHNFILTERF